MSALQAQAALPSGLGALEAAAAAATADAAAGAAPVEPGSLDEARAQLVSERARRQLCELERAALPQAWLGLGLGLTLTLTLTLTRQLCESELLTLKRQTDDALDRQLADLTLTLILTLTRQAAQGLG